MQPRKVDVIQLRGRWVNRQADLAIASMIEQTRARGHDVAYPLDVFGLAMVQESRNRSLKKVREDSDFVLFVDDDMIPLASCLNRLMGHDVTIAAALCTTRVVPPTIAAKTYDKETRRFKSVDSYKDNTFIRGPWAPGFGFVLVKTAVLFSIIDWVLSGEDWLELNRPLFDRLAVRRENRIKEQIRISEARRRLWESERTAPVFQMPLQADVQYTISEDNHFFTLAHHMGIDVWLDTGCLVGHLGDFPYSPNNLDMVLNPREEVA